MSLLELAAKAKATLNEAAGSEETAANSKLTKEEKSQIDKLSNVGVNVTRRDVTARRDKIIAILKDKSISNDLRKYAENGLDELDDVLDEIAEQEADEANDNEEEASVETAAPLSKEKYDWYKYVGARGTKITNSRGNRTVVLKNGSMFGIRAATSKSGKTRLVTEELGPTIVFSFEQEEAAKIIGKGVRIPVKVTFKRPEAPAAIKKVVKAAKKEATRRAKSSPSFANDDMLVDVFKQIKPLLKNIPAIASPVLAKWFGNMAGKAVKLERAIEDSSKNADRLAEDFLKLLSKPPKTKVRKKPIQPKDADIGLLMINNGVKLIKKSKSINELITYLTIAEDHLGFGSGMYSGDLAVMRKYKYFGSSSSRELTPSRAKTYLNNSSEHLPIKEMF